MKKMILAIAMLMAMGMQSASAATEAEFKAQQDSLSKAYGKYFGLVLAYMGEQDKKINIDEFFKAFDVVMQADTANQGYMNGLFVGMELTSKMMQNKLHKGITLDKALMVQALKDAVATKGLDQSTVSKAYSDMAVLEQNPKTIAMKKAGEEYIAKIMAAGEGYVKTASGLVYKMEKQGNGKCYGDNEEVRMLYTGKHVDGSIFDQSRDTTSLNSGRVVEGFKEALMLMSPGAKMIAVLPSDIAYGDQGAGRRQSGEYSINPGETLVFEIETFAPKAEAKTEAKAPEKATTPKVTKTKAKAKTVTPGKMPKPKGKQKK